MTESYEQIEARLSARAEEPLPESWKPSKEGDRIIGRVVRYERGVTGWGPAVICVVESLRRPGTFAAIWVFGTVLSNAFIREQPRRGEVILVEYRGKVHPQGGQEYKDWRLVVDRAGGAGLDAAEAFGQPPDEPPAAAPAEEPPSDWTPAGLDADPADDDIPF